MPGSSPAHGHRRLQQTNMIVTRITYFRSDHEKEKGVYGFTFDDFWKEDEEQRAKLLHVFRQRVEEMKQRKMKKTAPPLIRANSSNSDGQEVGTNKQV